MYFSQYFKLRSREKKRERVRERASFFWFTLQCLQQLEMGQAKAGNLIHVFHVAGKKKIT